MSSRVWFRPWVVMESTRAMNRVVFGHVNLYQCNITLQRLCTTEHNIVPQFATGKDISKPVQQDKPVQQEKPYSLAEISKPVPFNTHQLVCRLQCKGYTLEQAQELVEILNTVIQQSVASEIGNCVKTVSLDKMVLSLRGDIDNVRRDQILLEKTELAGIKSQLMKMDEEINELMGTLQEEVNKAKSGISLDINLERSRVKEEHGELHQKIKDTQNNIATQVADLKTIIESHKLEMVKYIGGGMVTVVTLVLSVVLGLWRLMK